MLPKVTVAVWFVYNGPDASAMGRCVSCKGLLIEIPTDCDISTSIGCFGKAEVHIILGKAGSSRGIVKGPAESVKPVFINIDC